jgi:cell wall-associated NlpC family hydrolase
MLVGSALDNGGRGIAQALVLAAAVLLSIFLVALSVPVMVLFSLMHPGLDNPRQTAQHGDVASEVSKPIAPGSGAPLGTDNAEVVDVARRYLGIPYVFGGTNPAVGLDCSGLVQLVFRQLGMALPRTAQQQYEATQHVTREQLQPGDLVFFAHTYADPHDWVTHVGIYIGNGQQINAPTEGQSVSIQPVFAGFWDAHFVSGGRVGKR